MSTTRIFLASLLLLLLKEWGAGPPAIPPVGDQHSLTHALEFPSPRFRAGLPKGGESLETALAEPLTEQLDQLLVAVELLLENPNVKVGIVGHTDNRECRQLACDALSLRRSRLVRDWLVLEGVPASQLGAASGGGARQPLAFNTTEEGRANNRRVEINMLRPAELP